MSEYQHIFKRYEMKFLLNRDQKERLKKLMSNHMEEDSYGRSTIRSLYFDTPTYRIIRASIEKPVYREKLRIRSYKKAKHDDEIFVELKKKYKKVVYKRRINMTEQEAMNYICCKNDGDVEQSQIKNEIDYFLDYYEDIRPSVLITYDREAFYEVGNRDFRVTFDENILWRKEDLSLCSEIYGEALLEEGYTLMEVKTTGGIPVWMTDFLTEEKIYKATFSKYGFAYRRIFGEKRQLKKLGLCNSKIGL